MLDWRIMLSGNLADFDLLSVMQMLLTSGRTGKLHLEHPRGGDVWIESGEVVHAVALGRTGEDALSIIASLKEGRFAFDQNAQSPEKTVTLRRESLLTRMVMEGDAWHALVEAFPDWSKPVRFTGGWSDQTRVTRRQYHALAALDRSVNIQDLVRIVNMKPREALETLLPFWQAGKIEYVR